VSVTDAPAAIVIPDGCASRFVFGLWEEITSWGVDTGALPRISDFTLAPPVITIVGDPAGVTTTSQLLVGAPFVQLSLSVKSLLSAPVHVVRKTPGVSGQAADALSGRDPRDTDAINPPSTTGHPMRREFRTCALLLIPEYLFLLSIDRKAGIAVQLRERA
jgi:hypothetical protein